MGRAASTFFVLSFLAGATACRPAATTGHTARRDSDDVSQLQMTGMHVQSFGEIGKDWELAAPFGEMFTRRNLMKLKNLTVTLFENAQKSSEITAGSGVMSTGPRAPNVVTPDPIPADIHLEPGDMYVNDNVVVISTDGSKLTTDWAIYNKKIDLITSTAPVKVERADSITKGVGLEASSNLASVRIFSETLIIPDQEKGTEK